MVQIADLDVLYNNILSSKTKTLAFNDTFGPDTQDGLVGANLDRTLGSLVVLVGVSLVVLECMVKVLVRTVTVSLVIPESHVSNSIRWHLSPVPQFAPSRSADIV